MKMDIQLWEKLIRLLNKINQTNKVPRDFGSGNILYQSEIHTIESIANHENVNASELSKILGITNGALNQVTSKLKKKGLIESYKAKNNNKEVYYRLTEKGKNADEGHRKYHEEVNQKLTAYLNDLEPDQVKTINAFLDYLTENWPHE
jgi:DNA-binding MarR family transcriptional regulator